MRGYTELNSQMAITGVAVEKFTLQKIHKIKLRQDALQTLRRDHLGIFYRPFVLVSGISTFPTATGQETHSTKTESRCRTPSVLIGSELAKLWFVRNVSANLWSQRLRTVA
jgi:hypothetical protein